MRHHQNYLSPSCYKVESYSVWEGYQNFVNMNNCKDRFSKQNIYYNPYMVLDFTAKIHPVCLPKGFPWSSLPIYYYMVDNTGTPFGLADCFINGYGSMTMKPFDNDVCWPVQLFYCKTSFSSGFAYILAAETYNPKREEKFRRQQFGVVVGQH